MRNASDAAERANTATSLRERLPGGAVCRRLGIGRVTLWRWRQAADFPQPEAVGGKMLLYDVARLEAWLSGPARNYQYPSRRRAA